MLKMKIAKHEIQHVTLKNFNNFQRFIKIKNREYQSVMEVKYLKIDQFTQSSSHFNIFHLFLHEFLQLTSENNHSYNQNKS